MQNYNTTPIYKIASKLWRFTKQFVETNNICAKIWCFFTFYSLDRQSKAQAQAILLYQMGKVGSTTIKKSLEAFNIPIYHFHRLNPEELDRFMKTKKGLHKTAPEHIRLGWHLQKQRKSGFDPRKWKIITLVRDPVARNLSEYFNYIKNYLPVIAHQYKTTSLTLENLRDFFLEKYPFHDRPLTWFDVEMKQIFGLDIYSVDFPVTKGYKIYKGDHPDVLLLRLENLNDCAQDAFNEFLGMENVILITDNTASERGFSPLYRKFLSSKLLPRTYIKRMYNSKFAQHFYTEEELNTFQKKWIAD